MNENFTNKGRKQWNYSCSYPPCYWYSQDKELNTGDGWCTHPGNMVHMDGKSSFARVSKTGGCDEHSRLGKSYKNQELVSSYVRDGLSIAQMSELLGCSQGTVYKYLDKFGLKPEMEKKKPRKAQKIRISSRKFAKPRNNLEWVLEYRRKRNIDKGEGIYVD